MTVFLLILAAVCLIYFLILMIGAGVSSAFVWFWAAAAAGFGGLGWLRRRIHLPRPVRVTVLILVIVGLIVFLAVEGMILSHFRDEGEPDLDYLIVLGAQVKGITVSRSLRMRLDTAVSYLEANPRTIVIVTGGQGRGEEITEAQAMADYLIEKGIPEVQIRREQNSTTTEENLLFSREFFAEEAPSIGIVTNDFHLFRAIRLGKKILPQAKILGMAAPSETFLQPNYLVREFFAVIKYGISGNL